MINKLPLDSYDELAETAIVTSEQETNRFSCSWFITCKSILRFWTKDSTTDGTLKACYSYLSKSLSQLQVHTCMGE